MEQIREDFDDPEYRFDDQKAGFGKWLKGQVGRDDIVGDLARDARAEEVGLTCKTVEAFWQHVQRKTGQRAYSLMHIVDALADAEREFLEFNNQGVVDAQRGSDFDRAGTAAPTCAPRNVCTAAVQDSTALDG